MISLEVAFCRPYRKKARCSKVHTWLARRLKVGGLSGYG